MKHNKLGLNHQNQNFVLIMTTDDVGGVLVLDVRWWETWGIVTEGFQIFLNLLKYFCFQIFSKPTCMRGGEKVGTKVTLEFILLLFSLSWILYTLLESILHLKTFLDTTSAACADCSNKIFVTNCYVGEPLPYGIKDYRIIRHKWTNILKIKVIQEWRSLESSSYGNEIWDKIWDEIMSFGHWSLAIGYCILVIGHRISPFWVEKLESLDIWKV